MTKANLLIAALLTTLSATPIFTPAARAQDRPRQEQRIYDKDHRDYHVWNTGEDQRYRGYLADHHRKYKDFSRLSAKQQRDYWNWRHDHDDRR